MIQYRHELPSFMRELNLPMIGAELGVAEGYNACDLIRGGIQKLYCIDVWESNSQRFGDISMSQEWHNKNYEDAIQRLAMFPKDRYTILRGFTTDMAVQVPENSCGLVYLDAGHDYESVMTDLKTYFPKLVHGGICAGHDYENSSYQVKQAVTDFVAGRFQVHVIPENGELENASFYFIKR